MHVSILERVHELGHYPERIVGHNQYDNATADQQLEEALRQQLTRHWPDLPKTYKTYIEGLQTDKRQKREHAKDDQKRKGVGDVMDKVRALRREPLTGNLYRQNRNEKQAYRKLVPEEISEIRLASQLNNLRTQERLLPEELEELDRIEVDGYQKLIETVGLFVHINGRLPTDPPLSVQGMEQEELADNSRDWTLAHEEMRLHQRLDSAKKLQKLTSSQKEQLQQVIPVGSKDMDALFNLLLVHLAVGEDLETSYHRATGEAMPPGDYNLLLAIEEPLALMEHVVCT